jgi:hypothetical protein
MSEEIETVRKKFLPGKDAKVAGYLVEGSEITYKYKGIYNMKYDIEIVDDGFVKYQRHVISIYSNE